MKTFRMLMGGVAAVLLVAACSGEDSAAPGDVGSDNEELVAGKPIAFKTLDVTRSNAKKGVTLIRTASEYKAFFGVKAPAGLFPKSWVLHYSMGTKPTGGYSVEPTQVNKTSTGGHKVKLSVTTLSPGKACLVTEAQTNPQVAVSFPAQSGVDTGVVALDAGTDLCGGCNDVSDCPKIKMPCKSCGDGTTICPQMTCDAGTCDLINTECPSTPAMCGGFAGIKCPAGQTCVDDPSDSCDPKKGGADCSGICVKDVPPQMCGGFGNIKCPKGFHCGEDPASECTKNGGADCSGICLAGEVCGDAICPEGTTCCNPLSGACVKPGMVCAQ